VIVQGNVTALEPLKFLRFTVFDVREEKLPVTDEDGITYELTEQDGKTLLKISQGDFSIMAEGEKYRDMSAEIWDVVVESSQVHRSFSFSEQAICALATRYNLEMISKPFHLFIYPQRSQENWLSK